MLSYPDLLRSQPGAENAAAVTPSDTLALATPSRFLFVGGAGNVKVDTVGGQTVVFTGVLAGTYLWVRATKVYATLTTATNIVSLS